MVLIAYRTLISHLALSLRTLFLFILRVVTLLKYMRD